MSDSNRSVVAATGLAQQQDSADQTGASIQPTKQDQSNASDNEGKAPLVAHIPAIEPESTDQHTEQAEYRAQADLQAQQDMAFYALLMVVATVATVVITALGVWFVKRTLDATLEAVKDTSEATDAMREANVIAKDAAHRQLRAYVSVRGITLNEAEWNANKRILTLEMRNVGTTPAHLKKIILTASWAYDGGSINLIDHQSPNDIYCHQGTPMHMPFSLPSHDDLHKEGHLMVFGRIEYEDIFGVVQKEPFSFRTPEGTFIPFWDHDLPLRLVSFSALSIIERMEKNGTANDDKHNRADG